MRVGISRDPYSQQLLLVYEIFISPSSLLHLYDRIRSINLFSRHNDMDPDKKPKSTIATASSILTLLAHGSAPFISTFLLVHLSAPIVANIGGSGLASSVMVSLTLER